LFPSPSLFFFFYSSRPLLDLLSFPTRRSSDLEKVSAISSILFFPHSPLNPVTLLFGTRLPSAGNISARYADFNAFVFSTFCCWIAIISSSCLKNWPTFCCSLLLGTITFQLFTSDIGTRFTIAEAGFASVSFFCILSERIHCKKNSDSVLVWFVLILISA